ncbi:hypothetical protein M2432_003350 [Mycobacterium sp. OTB74]|nr:hypothetical protein [Mycobacterium sp. OTB74]
MAFCGPPGQYAQSVPDPVEGGDDFGVEAEMACAIGFQSTTSFNLPVATSKMKPRNDSCLVTNGLASIRRSD